ncbi:DUF1800 family protein [Cognatishimia sp. MH4019]|uniref:DUF1800 domain-containing protein n=1 Tax=Cognatishimia sp. MH4019 TaxID=2854030 RepID=UPI001CD29D33|nr:DUF1800 domain-containing protein [Cognatishimia sp. MH4019]
MAVFDPYLAVRRFGTGLAADTAVPGNAGALLTDLQQADALAAQFDMPRYTDYLDIEAQVRELRRAKRETEEAAEIARIDEATKTQKSAASALQSKSAKARIARAVGAPIGFRDRLEWFWADHFTVRGIGGIAGSAVSSFSNEAIRPNLTARFADMLRAVVVQPLMLRSLDQDRSAGPRSRFAKRRGMGLNENYARELIELHTLGAGASYTQKDVVELARLLAGLGVRHGAFQWQDGRAEPGEKHVLGKVYGGNGQGLENVFAVVEDLARHPDTARHLARKMAVHFVSDAPDPGLVTHMAARYRAADGDLTALYAAMLEHPGAWEPVGNVKWPLEYVISGIKALGVTPEQIIARSRRDIQRGLIAPTRLMGQTYQRPVGPDGWAEDDAAWITPQGIAGRIQWAMDAPHKMLDRLPDPRAFLEVALGPNPPEPVRFAAFNAENAREGVGLILASSAFQRR